jgi:hypothetical protein
VESREDALGGLRDSVEQDVTMQVKAVMDGGRDD